MGNQNFIYADNAATTALLPEVLEVMLPYYTEYYGNASSPYSIGRKSKAALENARMEIAACLGAKKQEILFTSGGTESNNWAIRSIMKMKSQEGKHHLITSQIEHPSVLNVCKAWEKSGGEVTYLPVEKNGIVNPALVKESIRPATALVTIMMANNEIGTIQPIEKIGYICHENNILFHTDAVQAVGHLPISLSDLPVDLLSFSGHKFHAPKGIGGLYVKPSLEIAPLLWGGEQERAKRPGTENIAAAIGLAEALKLSCQKMEERNAYVLSLREQLIDQVLQIPQSFLNGDRTERLPSNTNFCFEGIEGESLLLMLDMRGICCSSGSACTSGAADPSHVILALGVSKDMARSSLRISLSHLNTQEEIETIVHAINDSVTRLRRLNPA